MSSYMCVYWKTSAMAVQIQQINNHKAGGNSYFFSYIFLTYLLFSFNWGSKRGSKIIKIVVVVEESTKNPILQSLNLNKFKFKL